MNELSDQEESDNSSSEEELNFNAELEKEKQYWDNYFLINYVYIPEKCPKCKHNKISIGNRANLISPKILLCNNKICKSRISLRNFSFLKLFKKIRCTYLMKILKYFIIDQKNATLIEKTLSEEDKIKLNVHTIDKILNTFRNIIAHYLKDFYRFHRLGKEQGGSNISMDESLFTHINGEKIWVVGARNNKTKNIRLDIFKTRNQEDLKIFINNHIKKNNNIITDGWSGYNFLDSDYAEYDHEVYVHGPDGNFGFGQHSTSHIEGTWGTIKSYIYRIYNKIPDVNFILFLREGEFRYRIRDMSYKEKETELKEIFKYVYDSAEYELYTINELIDNNNYDF